MKLGWVMIPGIAILVLWYLTSRRGAELGWRLTKRREMLIYGMAGNLLGRMWVWGWPSEMLDHVATVRDEALKRARIITVDLEQEAEFDSP